MWHELKQAFFISWLPIGLFLCLLFYWPSPKLAHLDTLWFNYQLSQYDHKARDVYELGRYIDLYTDCLTIRNEKPFSHMNCHVYVIGLDKQLWNILVDFNLSESMDNKVNTIIHRDNNEILDANSLVLAKQVYKTLDFELKQETFD